MSQLNNPPVFQAPDAAILRAQHAALVSRLGADEAARAIVRYGHRWKREFRGTQFWATLPPG